MSPLKNVIGIKNQPQPEKTGKIKAGKDRSCPVYRENKKHQQSSLFDSQFLLPPKFCKQKKASWAHTFFHEVFVRISEEPFAILYSEEDSRPNTTVNVLIGAEMLKTGFGWSDAELEENMQFDLLVRYALGLNNLNQEVTVLRTLYNFR